MLNGLWSWLAVVWSEYSPHGASLELPDIGSYPSPPGPPPR